MYTKREYVEIHLPYEGMGAVRVEVEGGYKGEISFHANCLSSQPWSGTGKVIANQ